MRGLVGEDPPLFQPVNRKSNCLEDLLDSLWRQSVDDDVDERVNEEVVNSNYFLALRSVLEDRKRELSLRFMSFEWAKLEDQNKSLKKSTEDCLEAISNIEKDISNDSIRVVHDYLQHARQELPQHTENIAEEVWSYQSSVEQILQKHSRIRPITPQDVEHAKKNLKLKQLSYGNQLLNDFCNFALLSSTFFLRKQKRRNFPKKATKILNQYFEEHMDEPYPSETTKQELADLCGVTVGQVSNWFGNKRIRFKKALEKRERVEFHQ
ncbi:unnamed protein product [Bursaphelenchus xylophilus]|uniref:(pine wood nematode) hypothetical protein n=1 Tax=Bursaphelenchus xylophilus TaxID=6326 RepID=A0A1I7SUJ8_BURXY|nr:unnamed protein product [Bursaphelenchus xylophilus]CAG9107052.1 unnamed protein product [Bursaphelenchus xylophilus]